MGRLWMRPLGGVLAGFIGDYFKVIPFLGILMLIAGAVGAPSLLTCHRRRDGVIPHGAANCAVHLWSAGYFLGNT
ncbi:MAG: hypothetical protein CM15mP103_09260 [Gammaproteobacteria bacterium]|nr:MAG: hypothetical protein CM15mP103_09260 [Gammaproteobacteria bacterium]